MKLSKPQVSIITPFYNTGDVFWETFDSIIGQTFTEWEWIIINDGSTDKHSLAILERVAGLGNKKIKIFHLDKNGGLPAARNRGIERAQSDYLLLIDSDDLIDKLAVEKFYIFLESNPKCEFVNSYVIGFGAQNYKWKGGFHEGSVFLMQNRNHSCFMGRSKVFQEVLFDENLREGAEDWDFWVHSASKNFWGYTIPEYLLWYRRNNDPVKWKVLSSEEELKRMGESLRNKYWSQPGKEFPTRNMEEYRFEKIVEQDSPNSSPVSGSNSILFLFPWLELGGADKFNLDLIIGLKNKGWNITIGCTRANNQSWEHLFAEQTKDIFFFPHYSHESGFYKIVEHLVITRRPSVIFISNSMYAYYVLPYIRQRFPEIPIVDYLHTEDPGWYNGGYPFFSAVYNRLLDKTFVSSGHLKQWCKLRGANEEKLQVAYINIDTSVVTRNDDIRKKIRTGLGVPENRPVILYVARLTEQKQPLVLLDSIDKLFKRTDDFLVIIIGDGPDREVFQRKLRKLSARKRIIYLGAQSNDKVKEYMDAADIFFLPTAYEGIAMTIYEAMAKNLAIIAADVGGQTELVTSDCGVLVPRSVPEQESSIYAGHLYDFIADRNKIYNTGRYARQRVVEHFQLEAMITSIQTALRQVILQHDPVVPIIRPEYLIVMNRMLHEQAVKENLEEQLSNRINRVLKKYDKEYRFAKKVYHKIKSFGNKK